MSYRDLQKAARDARKAADKADAAVEDARQAQRAAHEAAIAAERELDDEEWLRAQEELGIDRADVDLATRTVTTLPEGPTFEDAVG
jgi:DNA-directed RNA polymerase specialized sigma subunit